MKRVEQHYQPFEAAFLIRIFCGDLCNWYVTLSDIRRGKATRFPSIRHYRNAQGTPYYTRTDLLAFIEEVRRVYPHSKPKQGPQFTLHDIEEEMAI